MQLRTGASYAVDSASLALGLAAGASRSGEWVGFAGWGDFGAEAASQWGIDLRRTVLVPEPGELLARGGGGARRRAQGRRAQAGDAGRPKSASVIDARLRARSSTLVVWGEWPRVEARLSAERVVLERGRSRARAGSTVVSCGSPSPVASQRSARDLVLP